MTDFARGFLRGLLWIALPVLVLAILPRACDPSPGGSGLTDVDPVVYESKNVLYTCYSAERCDQLAVTFATGAPPAIPATIITIHGGNYDSGDRTDLAAMTPQFTAAGYPVIEVDYSLTDVGVPGFPQAVRDIFRVVDWVHTVGVPTYGLPDRVVTLGVSAGSTLALLAGYAQGVALFQHGAGDFRVDAVISCWAPSDLQTLNLAAVRNFLGAPSYPYDPQYHADLASPQFWVSEGSQRIVPTLILHGVLDTTVDVSQSDGLNEALNAARVYHHYYRNPTGTHSAASWGGLAAIADEVLQYIPGLLDPRKGNAMASKDQIVNLNPGKIIFGPSAVSGAAAAPDTGILFTPTSLAAGAGQQSTVCDLEAIYGKGKWPRDFRWSAFQKYTTAGVVGELTDIHIVYHESSTASAAHSDNDIGLVDAAIANEEKILGCDYVGSIYCHDADATVEAANHGDLRIRHPRFSIAWWNRNTNALSATAADMGMILQAAPDRVSDGSV